MQELYVTIRMRMLVSFFAFITSIGAFPQGNQTLIPFTTDGCSVAPDSLFGKDISMCCVQHDLAYWMGGAEEQKSIADMRLNACIEKSLQGESLGASSAYHLAVEIFGGPEYFGLINNPFPWRWGYGWRLSRGYAPLTPLEQKTIEASLAQFKTEIDRSPGLLINGSSSYQFRLNGIELTPKDVGTIVEMIDSIDVNGPRAASLR